MPRFCAGKFAGTHPLYVAELDAVVAYYHAESAFTVPSDNSLGFPYLVRRVIFYSIHGRATGKPVMVLHYWVRYSYHPKTMKRRV